MAEGSCPGLFPQRRRASGGKVRVDAAGDAVELLDGIEQLGDGAVQLLVGAAERVDFVDGMEHGGVVLAAELASDFRQRGGGELLHQVHGNLARVGDGFRVRAHLQVFGAELEVLADALLDQFDGDALIL